MSKLSCGTCEKINEKLRQTFKNDLCAVVERPHFVWGRETWCYSTLSLGTSLENAELAVEEFIKEINDFTPVTHIRIFRKFPCIEVQYGHLGFFTRLCNFEKELFEDNPREMALLTRVGAGE